MMILHISLQVQYAVRGPIVVRANQLKEELENGVKKPFDKIIMSSVGDCHAMGQKPITFTRQGKGQNFNASLFSSLESLCTP